MSRDYRLYLDDILQSIERIRLYTKDHKNVKELSDDSLAFDAVAFNLEIIGEAVKNLPDYVCSKYPDAEWKAIAGMRDKIIHHYHGINAEIVWDVVKNKLPQLKKLIDKILKESDK
jgi:uncharacterized protein with HEPN domain